MTSEKIPNSDQYQYEQYVSFGKSNNGKGASTTDASAPTNFYQKNDDVSGLLKYPVSTDVSNKKIKGKCCSCLNNTKPATFWVGLLTNLGICTLLLAYTLLGSFIFLAIETDDGMVQHQRTLASTKRQSLHRSILLENITSSATVSSILSSKTTSMEFTQSSTSDTLDVRQRTIENIWDITVSLNILYKENWTKLAALEIAKFQDQLIKRLADDAANDIGSADSPSTGAVIVLSHQDGNNEKYDWNFAKAFLYSLTVLTTIGYGTVAPRTTLGRIVTLAYAMLGIPLTLVYLSSTGGVLAKVAREVFSRALCCCLCSNCGYCCYDEKRMAEKERRMRRKRQLEELRAQQNAINDPFFVSTGVHNNFQSPEKPINFSDTDSLSNSESRGSMHGMSILAPILLCLCMMIIYIIFGALALYRLEDWPLLDGIYFCFMSLSTIGFGDLMPGMKKSNSTTTTWFCSLYIMSGMALTAMCFNVLHEEIVSRIKVVVEFKKPAIKDIEDPKFFLPP